MPASSAREASQIGRRVGAVGGGSRGIRLGERVADDLHRRLGVARVVPPVRVVARRLGALALAGHAHGHLAAEVDDLGRAARVRDHGAHPGVEAVAVEEHELRARDGLHVRGPRLVVVRIGVGLQDLMHARRVTRDRARPVADLRRRGDDPRTGAPLRRAASAGSEDEREQRSRAGERRAPPHHVSGCMPEHRQREQPATEHGDRRPRRRVQLDREPQAGDPQDRRERHRRQLPDGQALRPQAHGRRGHDEQRGREQRADRRERGDHREGDEHQQHGVRQARAQAQSARRGGIESAGEPARPEHERGGDRRGAGQAREHEIARAGQQQAPEEQRVDVAARFEDVARQHDAARQRGDQHERGQAVVARARAAREALHAEREHERRGERAERRREAEPVGQHEPGEGRGADRVGVEREPAHHDPRAEQPRRDATAAAPRARRAARTRAERDRARRESNRYSFPLQTATGPTQRAACTCADLAPRCGGTALRRLADSGGAVRAAPRPREGPSPPSLDRARRCWILLSRPDMRTTGTLERRPHDHATARSPEPGAAAQAGQGARARAPRRRRAAAPERCAARARARVRVSELAEAQGLRRPRLGERPCPDARVRRRHRLLRGPRRGPAQRRRERPRRAGSRSCAPTTPRSRTRATPRSAR